MDDDPNPAQSWAEQRGQAAEEHAATQRRKKDLETLQARAIVAAFVADAQERGIPPEPLTASPYTGRGRYRTDRTGWYVRQNRSLAIGTDGEYYVLTVPASLRSRLRGASVPPVDPPLVTGAGGRDGESIPLVTLLQMRLEAGTSFP